MRKTQWTRQKRAAWAAMFTVFLVTVFCLAAASANAAVIYNATVNTMINGVSQTQLLPAVNELSGETTSIIGGSSYRIVTRGSSSGLPIDMAEQYIYEHLLSYGLSSVAYQAYPGKGGGVQPGRNIIGQINGTTKASEIVIVSAHLDNRPWDVLAYGADDDASGCSANLYLARTFAGKTFQRTIRFCFFGSEENAPWSSSSYGSGYYANQCKLAGENIVAVIDADALAYNGSNSGIVNMVTRSTRKDPGGLDHAICTMWQEAGTTYAITGITRTLQASGDNLSDHGSFWSKGYPAVMLIEDDLSPNTNPYWHTLNDRVSTFNWPFYVQVTKSLVAVAAHEAGIQ